MPETTTVEATFVFADIAGFTLRPAVVRALGMVSRSA